MSDLDIDRYNPTFVLGISPRCGSTMLVNLLQASGDFDRPSEMEFRWLDEMYATKQTMTYYHWKQYWARRYISLCPLPNPIMKNPFSIHGELIREIFPSCNIVLIERDCRSILYSSMKSFSKITSVESECKALKHRMIHWLNCITQLPNVHRIKYEDLMLDPTQQFCYLCDKLGRSFDIGTMTTDMIFGSCEFEVDGKWRWMVNFKPENFHPEKRWTQLSNEQQETYKRICGDVHEQLGYSWT